MDKQARLRIVIDRFGKDYIDVKDGNNVRYNCPFCVKRRGKEDHDFKFYVSYKKLSFYCFKCHIKGRLRKSISGSTEGVYNDILDLVERRSDPEDQDEDNVFYVPKNKIIPGTLAYDYLKNRGIYQDLIDYYDMRLGINDMFGRIVVPNIIYGQEGVWTDMFSSRSYIGQEPKYLNPQGDGYSVKSKCVFNLHRVEGDVVYIVEGVFTAICAGKEAVCIYGSSPSEQQLSMLVNRNFKEYYCVLDNDEAGRKGNEELAEKLSRMVNEGTRVYIVYMPEGIDAADIGEKKFKEYVENNKILYQSSVYARLIRVMKNY